MIQNAALEEGFRYYNGIGELELAEWWTPWYYEQPDVLHRPEYKPHTDTDYVHSGAFSQKMFTTRVAHHAGMSQLVTVSAGKWYTFSAWGKIRVGPSTDSHPYVMAVGANPYGAEPTDKIGGLFSTMGEANWLIDTWVNLSVTFQAWGPTVRVFTLGLAKHGLDWNDSYWDDFLMIEADGPGTPQPPQPPTPGPGVDYERIKQIVRRELEGAIWTVEAEIFSKNQ